MSTAQPMFGTDEILWYDNGKWGQVGYAVANPNGKIWTNNSVIFQFHSLIGRNMFELMHRTTEAGDFIVRISTIQIIVIVTTLGTIRVARTIIKSVSRPAKSMRAKA